MPAAPLGSPSRRANADPGRLGFVSRGFNVLFTLQNVPLINLCSCPKIEGVQLSTGLWQGYDTKGSSRQPSLLSPKHTHTHTLRSSDLSAAEPAAKRTSLTLTLTNSCN